MQMNYCVSLCLSHRRHKLLRVFSSVELLIKWTNKRASRFAYPAWNKGMIQFDLDESCHVIKCVLEQSRDDDLIYLPLVTRRHSKLTNMMQLLVAHVKLKIIHKSVQKFDSCVNSLGYPCQRSDLSIRYSYCLYKDKINVAFDLLNKGSVSI